MTKPSQRTEKLKRFDESMGNHIIDYTDKAYGEDKRLRKLKLRQELDQGGESKIKECKCNLRKGDLSRIGKALVNYIYRCPKCGVFIIYDRYDVTMIQNGDVEIINEVF